MRVTCFFLFKSLNIWWIWLMSLNVFSIGKEYPVDGTTSTVIPFSPANVLRQNFSSQITNVPDLKCVLNESSFALSSTPRPATLKRILSCTRKLNGQHFFMERRTQITYIVSLLITLVVVISGAVIVCVPQLSAVYGAAVIYRLCTYIIIALCLFLILHLSLYKMIWNVEQAIHSSSNVKKTWGRIIGKAVIYCFVIVLICVLNSISGYQTFMDLLFKGNVTECALLLCFALLGILLSQNNQISSSGK